MVVLLRTLSTLLYSMMYPQIYIHNNKKRYIYARTMAIYEDRIRCEASFFTGHYNSNQMEVLESLKQ